MVAGVFEFAILSKKQKMSEKFIIAQLFCETVSIFSLGFIRGENCVFIEIERMLLLQCDGDGFNRLLQ